MTGITTTTPYGRGRVAWPDFGHEGGTALHAKIVAGITKLSDHLTGRWTGEQTLANSASFSFTHNFGMALTELEVRIYEGGALVSLERQAKDYAITQTDTNTIGIQNVSGGSKTFTAYVFGFSWDRLLGREKASLDTTDATPTVLKAIAIPTDESVALEVFVSARKDGTVANLYKLVVMAENNGGTVAVRQASKLQDEDAAAWDVSVVASGGEARVQVTGEAATTIGWSCVVQKTYF